MEGMSVESQAIKSEPEGEMPDHTGGNNVDWSVKQEPIDDASFPDLTDPGGILPAFPMEGMFEFHAVKSEESPRPTSQQVEGVSGDQVTAHRVKDECNVDDPSLALAYDPLDITAESVQTSSPDYNSLADIALPPDYFPVKVEDGCLTQSGSQAASSERSPQGPLSAEGGHRTQELMLKRGGRTDKSSQSDGTSRGRLGSEEGAQRAKKRPRSSAAAEMNRSYEEMAAVKLELVELQIAITRRKLERIKNGSSVEEAQASLRRTEDEIKRMRSVSSLELERMRIGSSLREAQANLRRTEYELKLQTLKDKYKRDLEKHKLRAEISRIDKEIKKCIMMKKLKRCDNSTNGN